VTRIVLAIFTLAALTLAGPRPGVSETHRPLCADYGDSAQPRPSSNWVVLHRPDGEIVHIRTDQIVFVTSAVAGAAKRAHSKIQLLNGYSDVHESVEEVMQAIQTDASKQISTR
jgi:hypothetical protein